MKHVLIVENATDSLKKQEAINNKVLLSGIFTEFNVENRNKRFYTANNFIPCMEALLNKKKLLGVVYGEFDHPDVFDIAGKNISHAIEDLSHNENSNRVDGTISLLSTHYGKEARAIINDGYPLFVSSRAAGVTEGSNNEVVLKELFTYDAVVDPGFASAQVSMNESLGYRATNDVNYRIYEMNDNGVQNLFVDNKKDSKTNVDILEMQRFLQDQVKLMENQILEKINGGKTESSDIKALIEKQDMAMSELSSIKEYLDFLKTKISHLVIENKKLNNEVNENTQYYTHIVDGLNNVKNDITGVVERIDLSEKMLEYVAENTKANILFTEHVASETELTQLFAESIAKETEVTQLFSESIANETKKNIDETAIIKEFAQYNAKETKLTQMFAESIAKELHIDDVFLNYIAEKVDGILEYTDLSITKLKNSIPLSENNNDDSIHNIENIKEYLGIDDEQEILNNIENEEEVVTDEEPILDVDGEEVVTDEEPILDVDGEEVVTDEEPILDVDGEVVTDEEPVVTDISELEQTLVSALVKVLGTDETGIVINIEGDKVVIQKSGSDDTAEYGVDDLEVIDTDNNLTETVANVLEEIKKQKTLNNTQPHFFKFLSEEQVVDFKLMTKESQHKAILALENSEFFNASDVMRIIGESINDTTISREDKLIGRLPVELKESWIGLNIQQKKAIIAESVYIPLHNSSDIENFWKTRNFAKAILSPEAKMIKESLNADSDTTFSSDFIDNFTEAMKKYK